MKRALILVDIQNDFCKGGALAVPDGDAVVPVANRMMVDADWDVVVATQDWHPPTHLSFASNNDVEPFKEIELNGIKQPAWPDHCVWGTRGAEFHPDLITSKIHAFIRKGWDKNIDSYSGFAENGTEHRRLTGLGGLLDEMGVTDVYVMGLALDVCVKATALDAHYDYNTYLIEDGCRAVDKKNGRAAIKEMRDGVSIVKSSSLIRKRK